MRKSASEIELALSETLQKTVRKYVYDYFLERERAPVIEEIMEKFHLDRMKAHQVLLGIEQAHNLSLVPGTQRILMAHPFSAIATPFKVTIGSKTYYANCAWDSVAFHVMLSQDIRVDSFCHHCAKPIKINLEHGKAISNPPEPLVFLSMPRPNGGTTSSTPAQTTWYSSAPSNTLQSGRQGIQLPRERHSRLRRLLN